ncbi:uncharacterized protein LOC135428127 [Drosophila montana]|uniref:uncharacterized protein LOC135428127 n=1 Tax=Drosophila montana TaxID=40370 RepID=UPI00313D6FEC
METYGMAAPDNDILRNFVQCYQQYVAQTGYRCERPEDGDHMREDSRDCIAYGRHDWYPQRPRNYHDDDSNPYRGAGYRSPMRHGMENRRYDSRNGLYSPTEMRRGGGGGDNYNSLPGVGSYERPSWHHTRRNRWF